MIIDSHQHVWDLGRSPYPWLGPEVPSLHRTIEFAEVQPQLARNGVDATVLVQSDDADGDTELMLEVADAHRQVAGVVAYVPLDRPEQAAERLAELRRSDLVVGVRNLIHDRPDPDWILRPEVDEGLSVLEQADVTFDLVAVLPRHLEHVPTLMERHPDLRMVIDHLAKPPIGQTGLEPWWSLIDVAARNPLVYAKISGLYPGAAPATWTVDGLRPFLDRALDVFGPDRLMYGGDWPISIDAGGYDAVFTGLRRALAHLSPEESDAVWGQTAQRFYGIPDSRLDAAAAAV